MSKFLKPKTFTFTRNYDANFRLEKWSLNHKRLSTQINIKKLRLPSDLDTYEKYFHRSDQNPLKNIGFGVTEKRKLPESSVCEILNLESSNRPKELKNKGSLIHDFYTRRKTSNKTLKVVNDGPLIKIQDNEMNDKYESFDTVKGKNYFNATVYACFRPTKNVKQRPQRKKFPRKAVSNDMSAKKLENSNCVSVQTDDLISVNNN